MEKTKRIYNQDENKMVANKYLSELKENWSWLSIGLIIIGKKNNG